MGCVIIIINENFNIFKYSRPSLHVHVDPFFFSSSSSSSSSSSTRGSKRQKNEKNKMINHPGQWLFEEGLACLYGSDFKKEDETRGQLMI